MVVVVIAGVGGFGGAGKPQWSAMNCPTTASQMAASTDGRTHVIDAAWAPWPIRPPKFITPVAG